MIVSLDEIPRAAEPCDPSLDWRPVRDHLGISSFGVNAFLGAQPGDRVVELHDESGNGHEELYVVVRGAARFVLDGAEHAVPAGSVVLVAPVISTSTSSPGGGGVPPAPAPKLTVLLCRVRPRRRDGSVRDGPSTSTSSVRPTNRCARSVARRWTASTRRSMRSRLTACGSWSGRSAASVPRRGEKMKVNAES